MNFFSVFIFDFCSLGDGNKCAGKPVGPYHVLRVLLPFGQLAGTGTETGARVEVGAAAGESSA